MRSGAGFQRVFNSMVSPTFYYNGGNAGMMENEMETLRP